MELRAAVQCVAFRSSWSGAWEPGRLGVRGNGGRGARVAVCRVEAATGAGAGAEQLTPKEAHHKRKKEEWKRLRRARRLEKLAEQARERERQARGRQPRRRQGLCSFEKYQLAKERGAVRDVEWKAGMKGKSTLVRMFEEDFAARVREAVSSVKPSIAGASDGEDSLEFRADSHSVDSQDVSEDWLLRLPGIRHVESLSDDGNVCEVDEGIAAEEIASGSGEQDEHDVGCSSPANPSSRPQLCFINHSFSDQASTSGSSGLYEDEVGLHSREKADGQGDSFPSCEPRDWRVNPKTPRRRDPVVGRHIIDRRKGEPLSTLLDEKSDGIPSDMLGILEALHEDVASEIRRKPVEETEQLEWLVQELVQADKKQKFFLSRLMHGARLKWTDGRLLELVKMLGARREWRRAMEVVHWVHSREHFRHCRSRYVCTTLLAVLGKCLRPVEALNVFNVMREEHSTYPDMAAYHSIAATLGKAGHLTQLLQLIDSLKEGPSLKNVRGSPRELNWNGRLEPDIVVYNAVINACGPHRQWEGTEWVLRQLQSSKIRPNSTTYGLTIEVMVKSGKYDKAWRYYEIMERGGFLPNALTFKALVEALGTVGEVDKATEMVEEMERRGVLECAGVYYALASALCAAGRLSEALVQVDKLLKLPSKKPDVVTFTGLIRTCEKVGRWQDAISIFNRMQFVCAPNVGTYNIMIALYGRHHLFEQARDLFELVKKGRHKFGRFLQDNSRLSPTVHTYESMLGACAVCEDWGYFEVVLDEFHTSGFQLDCRRHAWFIYPIVKAGQERLIHLVARRLQPPEGPLSANLYKFLLPLLSMHGYHTLVLNYLNDILELGVALNTPEWSLIVGEALQQLPTVDAEQFFCSKVTVAKMDDNVVVKELLQCLVSVGAERKARRLVNLLGLEVCEFVPATLGDLRLLPQGKGNTPSLLENKQVQKMARMEDVYLNDKRSIYNNAAVKAVDDGFQVQVRPQDILKQRGEKVLCGPRIAGRG